ncbi:MAG: 5-formyltetrahydrofolate cyclo-ligase [Acidimicrobiia bacterium]|nr:5-formyltetrahydrofolate cyclo-ligase [Acidimicrobiia bacterium]
MATKRLWREWADGQVWTVDTERIRSGIEAFLRGLEAPIVLTYSAMPGEADVESIEGAGQLLLTRTPEVGGLTVHRADSPMETHRWGYRQPVAEAARVESMEIDVVLVPGALFDRRGGRLGHGRGYYDRLLVTCRPDVIRVGVTTAGAIVERIPTEPHDIAMTHLATEAGVRQVSG